MAINMIDLNDRIASLEKENEKLRDGLRCWLEAYWWNSDERQDLEDFVGENMKAALE